MNQVRGKPMKRWEKGESGRTTTKGKWDQMHPQTTVVNFEGNAAVVEGGEGNKKKSSKEKVV